MDLDTIGQILLTRVVLKEPHPNEKAHTLCVLDTVYEPFQFLLVLHFLV